MRRLSGIAAAWCLAGFLVTAASAASGPAILQGRITVDGRAVAGEEVSLSIAGKQAAVKKTRTNRTGRYAFRGVRAGRYKLNFGLTVPEAWIPPSKRPTGLQFGPCRAPNVGPILMVSGEDRTTGATVYVASVESTAFRVRAGERVTKDFKLTCK